MNNNDLIIQTATKKLETTMIGALSRFENVFGYLWGQHKNFEEQLTDKEIHFENMWQDVRNNILNHGNQQIRGLQNEIAKLVSDKPQVRYNYKFNVNNHQKDQE